MVMVEAENEDFGGREEVAEAVCVQSWAEGAALVELRATVIEYVHLFLVVVEIMHVGVWDGEGRGEQTAVDNEFLKVAAEGEVLEVETQTQTRPWTQAR